MSLKDTINKVNTKIDTVAKSLEADNFGLGSLLDKNTEDLVLKDVKDIQKNIGNKLEALKAKLKNKKQRSRRHAISVKRKDSDKVFTYMIKEHYAPTVVKIAGKDVKFRYTTSVKSVKKSKTKSKSK